jgi:transketolase
MNLTQNEIELLGINTIRTLAMDAIQKANSGHPGMPMGCAPIAYLLYTKIMKHNPANPHWFNRDRFIISGGHGSMLLYSILHLTGYGITLDDIKNFRQWGSITPGHPEFGMTPGVETTTGPLGQGLANAVGMAVAQKYLQAKFNKENYEIINHKIYVTAGDGDLMEGISHEAASFAGHNKLDSIVLFYDNNHITIDGSTSLSCSDDVQKRFEAYGWFVQTVNDVNNLDELEKAVHTAQGQKGKPSIIITNTHIGFGSPNKQDTASVHGSPLGEEEIKLTKKNLGWDENAQFYIPEEVTKMFTSMKIKFENYEKQWDKIFDKYSEEYPADAELFKAMAFKNKGGDWKTKLPKFEDLSKKLATRAASGKVINAIAASLPSLFGGSADLAPSNNTKLDKETSFSASNYGGRNMHYGIREHAMGAMMNGMAVYGSIIPYGGTFLVFSDYMRHAVRIAALSHLKVIYVFTHDSIGLGEDGPTHQPVEQMASLRAIPNLTVIRPADANETAYAWQAAIDADGPTALILSRQGLPVYDRTKFNSAEGVLKGGYVIKDSAGAPSFIIIATGSEVELAVKAAAELEKENIPIRVVNLASWELFEKQSDEYKESVLPKSVKGRLSIEAGVKFGWKEYVGCYGGSISIEKYGASAPDKVLFEKYGFTVENVVQKAKEIIKAL